MLEDFRHSKSVACFCKALSVYVVIKIILVWPVTRTFAAYQELSVPRSLIGKIVFAPSFMVSIDWVYGVTIALLLASLFVRWNYPMAMIFAWLILNIHRINHVLVNGEELVLLMLAFWSVFMVQWPTFQNHRLKIVQHVAFNIGVLCCQLQIAFVYFVSGWDKLMNEAWRSGDALIYIASMYNRLRPEASYLMEIGFLKLTLSWLAILFELAFIFLIWFKPFRFSLLLIGVVFHLIIGVVLSLPDFSAIMIVSYLIFLKDSDYDYLKAKFKRFAR